MAREGTGKLESSQLCCLCPTGRRAEGFTCTPQSSSVKASAGPSWPLDAQAAFPSAFLTFSHRISQDKELFQTSSLDMVQNDCNSTCEWQLAEATLNTLKPLVALEP